ncbi:MAG: fumarylacetoacetate hydrolase family protein [Alkalispirochaeta sp.]
MVRPVHLPFGDTTYEVRPSKIIALGLNYRSHIHESGTVQVRGFDDEEPSEPILFPKLPSCIIGPGNAIELPAILGDYDFPEPRTDYEGELAVVIGAGGRDIPVTEAKSHVLEYTCANDVSQRKR